MPKRSIVIPCYNEAENLPTLISRYERLRDTTSDWELILVNNGSTDSSAEVFARELDRPGRDFIQLVEVPVPNVGYGHGIMTGLRAARGQYLGWSHADGQTPPGDVLAAFEILERSADPDRTFVKGRRRGRPAQDVAFTFGMELAATGLLGTHLSDINAQPKVFTRALLELATEPPDDLSLDLYFFWLAKTRGFAIKTFDVLFLDREHGESRWAFNLSTRWKNVVRTLRYMRSLSAP